MADITYIVNQDNPDNISGVEKFSQADLQLVNQFGINTLFDRTKNYIELHIFNLADEILQSDYDYRSYLELGNAQSAGKEGASVLTIDAIADTKKYGYLSGDVKLLYHFVNDLFSSERNSTQFFIQDISTDRTELKLQTFDLSNEEIIKYVGDVQNRINNQPYFNEFRLNFKNNDLLIGINIDTLVEGENNIVTVKLYEPLPGIYDVKATLNITELVSDSIVFEVDSSVGEEVEIVDYIRPANFNLDIVDNDVIPTQYLNYDELFSYPVNNTNSQVYSLFSEKGAELSIDHTEYINFIHFSSAYERLANFKYKLQLIEGYSSSLAQISNATSQSVGITGSTSYYENLTQGILNNLDHYERYLYFQSSSYAWPKSNNTTPYINRPTTDAIAQSWYANQLSIANSYDLTNLNAVENTIPSFLRDDPNNQNYLTFIHMIGQHFDNLWIYAKGVSDKYDADNRLNSGISKDLVGEVLKNFGVKLYTSNKSIEDLFSSFVGQAYQSGSEKINNYIIAEAVDKFIISLPTASIGTQDWTTQNLDVTTYRNGDTIPQVTDTTAWGLLTTGAWCYYNNDATSGSVYGKLYNWYAVNDPRGLAPEGYHIPTTEEWFALTSSLGGVGVAGGKMKSTSSLWQSPNVGATNSSNFTGLPGGQRSGVGLFSGINVNGNWWSSTNTATTTGQAFRITGSTDNVSALTGTSAPKDAGFSIRLLADPNTTPVPPTSYDNYQKEVQKRIYHNLPLLLKSKGTERGLRALINCFGIPSDIFDIKLYGGRDINQRPFYGDYRYSTSSLDKVRLDNTGSIITGSTLSQYTSIVKREYKYTDDLHPIELGFSPTDNVDNYIISKSLSTASLASFNIDDYLGDPRNLYQDNYYTFSPAGGITGSLDLLTNQIMSGSDAYDVQDFVRLIKFFDNTIFKMVKDFIPARSTADTGIIIKPHLLQRNKAKSVLLSGSRPEYTASIDTAFTEGGNGGAFISRTQGIVDGDLNASYRVLIQTPLGLATSSYHNQQEASFDGELRNSSIRVTNGELNRANFFKVPTFFGNTFEINRWLNKEGVCILKPYSTLTNVDGEIYYSSSNNTYYLDSGSWSNTALFSGLSATSMIYQITSSNIPTSSFQFPFNTNNYANYTTHSLTASNTGVEGICTSSVNIQVAVCDVDTTDNFRTSVKNTDIYSVASWFVTGSQNLSSNMNLTIVNNTGPTPVYNNLLANATASTFPGSSTDTYTLTVQDTKIPLTCTYTYPISAGICSVISRQINLRDGNWYWYVGVNMGTTPIGQGVGPSTLTPYNYGLAAYFTGVNPDELEYKVQIGTRFGGILVEVPVTLPVFPFIYANGTGTFFPALGHTFNMFEYKWEYGPVTNPGGNHPPILGNVALFKISYSPQFLATYPQSSIDSQEILFERLAVTITANEQEPDCTPYVTLIPPPRPDQEENINICCFAGDTLVTLADLTTKRIDAVRVGDKVLSYNEITNEQVISEVVAITSPTKNNIVKFSLSNGTIVEATTEHPFWEVNKGWSSYSPPATLRDHKMKVVKIEEGDILLTQEGVEVQIVGMELDLNREYEQVHNIKLEGHYTYYANGIVVHNEKPPNEQEACFYDDTYIPDGFTPIP